MIDLVQVALDRELLHVFGGLLKVAAPCTTSSAPNARIAAFSTLLSWGTTIVAVTPCRFAANAML